MAAAWRDDIITTTTILFRVTPSQSQGAAAANAVWTANVAAGADYHVQVSWLANVTQKFVDPLNPAGNRIALGPGDECDLPRLRRRRASPLATIGNIDQRDFNRDYVDGDVTFDYLRELDTGLAAIVGGRGEPAVRERGRGRGLRRRGIPGRRRHPRRRLQEERRARTPSSPSSPASSRSRRPSSAGDEDANGNESLVKRLVVQITSGVLRVELDNVGDGHVIAGPGAHRDRSPAGPAQRVQLARDPRDAEPTGGPRRARRRLRGDRRDLGGPQLPRRQRQLPAVGERAAAARLPGALHRLAERHAAVAGPRRRDLARSEPVRAGHLSARCDDPRPVDAVRSRSPRCYRRPARSSSSATRTFSDVRRRRRDHSITGDGLGGADSLEHRRGRRGAHHRRRRRGRAGRPDDRGGQHRHRPGRARSPSRATCSCTRSTPRTSAWSFGDDAFQGIDSEASIVVGEAAVIEGRDIRLETDASTLKSALLTESLDPADPSGLEAQINEDELVEIAAARRGGDRRVALARSTCAPARGSTRRATCSCSPTRSPRPASRPRAPSPISASPTAAPRRPPRSWWRRAS